MRETPEIPGERFVLLDRLGEGGDAMVWRARDQEMHALVAVKILRSLDPNLRTRFFQEVDVLANLQHANVIRAVARGMTGEGAPYVALELIAGRSLRVRLDAEGLFPWREVVAIGVTLAGALAYLHTRGVIHRDVKPENVMLATDVDGGYVVKLIDFGVAKLTDDWAPADGFTPTPRRRTTTGFAVGTPGYMPPEAGYEPPDERFDVYGLAATLHELCCGEHAATASRSSLPPGVPVDLGLVLAAALAIDPDDRTQSAAEFGRALEAVLTAHPEQAASSLLDARYERIAVIGTGAHGDVYHANHRGSGHDVALKFLRSAHPDDVRRFVREATLLSQLSHPCIPRFYDFASEFKPPYIAMARATGVPAVYLCPPETNVLLTATEVAQVGLQLAETLDYLHKRGVLHRDVNANNVIIDLQREPRVTLIDLGCAALTDAYHSLSAARYLTPPERRVEIPDGGIETRPWAAPEARAGRGFIDRSDVYSLGFLLYRLLTGKRPALRDDGAPVSPRTHNPRCPQDVALAIVAALNPDPLARPTAAQLAERFRVVLAREEEEAPDEAAPPPPPPPSVPTSTRGWTRFTAVTDEPREPSGADVSEPAPLANILPFHPRDRATNLDPAFAAQVRPKRWRVWASAAALMALGVLAGTAVRETTPAELVMAMGPSSPATPATDVQAASAPMTNIRDLLPLDEMLKQIEAPLRGCSKRTADQVLLIQFQVAEGLAQFAQVSPVGETSSAARRCILEALADVRFAPASAETFALEYTP